jgi:hypothetical protein
VPLPSRKGPPAIGYNLQITKVCDLGGGHETVTINTGAPPDASPEMLYGKIKLMRLALQKEIDQNCALERKRQAEERMQAAAYGHAPGTGTPEALPDVSGAAADAEDDAFQATQARAALADPKNRTRVPWSDVKRDGEA